MRVRHTFIVSFLSVLCCMPVIQNKPFQISVQTDKFFPGTKAYSSSKIYTSSKYDNGTSFINFMTFVSGDTLLYSISASYIGSDWMFINKLMVLCDSNVLNFDVAAEPKRTVGHELSSTILQENVLFGLDSSTAHLFKLCKSISIRLIGSQFTHNISLDTLVVKNINFYFNFIDTAVVSKL